VNRQLYLPIAFDASLGSRYSLARSMCSPSMRRVFSIDFVLSFLWIPLCRRKDWDEIFGKVPTYSYPSASRRNSGLAAALRWRCQSPKLGRQLTGVPAICCRLSRPRPAAQTIEEYSQPGVDEPRCGKWAQYMGRIRHTSHRGHA